MSWDNIATAFTKYSKIFGTSPSTSPMSWDSRRQELHWESCHKSPKRKSIMLWHFNYIFGVHFAYTLSTVYFLVQQLFGYGPKKELLNVIYLLLIGILNWFGSVLHVMITLYGRDAVNGWNNGRAMEVVIANDLGKY